MKHDGKIDIATGLSARSKSWKNKTVSWSKLVAKLKTPTVTNETFKEYLAAAKPDRMKIKDVGGYVGGYLHHGRRKPENVIHRQLITLDIDFGHMDLWTDFLLEYQNAAVLHATHSHSERSPKFRLIMPLSREVTSDEYAAVSRRVAGELGIDLFDNTGFQPYRLMFWPSVSSNVEYYCKVQDGPWLDVDEVLDSYVDWQDSSLWPTSSDQFDQLYGQRIKQEDPALKKGVVGVFCRRYDIHEAISEFLPDEYEETTDGRYTYTGGSTASGLVTYDDKFAYSHHGTDPSGGMLCNAFDLVRVHKFGHLDDSPTSKKSFSAMSDFACEDPEIRKLLAKENLEAAKYEFADGLDLDEVDEEDVEWAKKMQINSKGDYLATSNNLNLIFLNDPHLKKAFRYNQFSARRYLFKSVPWRKIEEPETIRDVDLSGLRNYIEGVYGITSVGKIDDALALEFERNSYHPVREYLNALEWDSVPRIDTLLVQYFGADDTLFVRESIRKTLVAAVARVMSPGCKFDYVLTLVGDEGIGKSELPRRLAGKWFSDSFTTVHGKESFEQLQGAWLIEMAELAGLRKAEVEAVKHFITKQTDTFRPAYGRVIEDYPRQCIFIGSTNNDNFLRGSTGNRRFLPIDVYPEKAEKNIFKMPQSEVDQIWAEAVELYHAGEKLYLSKAASAMAKDEQTAHSLEDSRRGLVEDYLDTLLPSSWDALDIDSRRMYLQDPSDKGTYRAFVCVAEIWCECFGYSKEDMAPYKTRDINDIMKLIPEWLPAKGTKSFSLYGKQRYYYRDLL